MKKRSIKTRFDDSDFENMGWRDNYVHGFYLDAEKFRLILDIDYIHQWIEGDGENYEFLISVSTLTFLNVSNLKIDVDWNDASLEMSIESISRSNPRGTLNKKLVDYDWEIALNWPSAESKITFISTGFTQLSREKPAVYEEQKIPFAKRLKL